jgi:hypothetical protein
MIWSACLPSMLTRFNLRLNKCKSKSKKSQNKLKKPMREWPSIHIICMQFASMMVTRSRVTITPLSKIDLTKSGVDSTISELQKWVKKMSSRKLMEVILGWLHIGLSIWMSRWPKNKRQSIFMNMSQLTKEHRRTWSTSLTSTFILLWSQD